MLKAAVAQLDMIVMISNNQYPTPHHNLRPNLLTLVPTVIHDHCSVLPTFSLLQCYKPAHTSVHCNATGWVFIWVPGPNYNPTQTTFQGQNVRFYFLPTLNYRHRQTFNRVKKHKIMGTNNSSMTPALQK